MKNRPLLLALSGSLALCLTLPVPLRADTYNWGFDANGNWNDSSGSAGWNAATAFPNATSDIANLTLDITAPRTVTMNVPGTVGALNINDTGASGDSGWTLDGASQLTFAVSSGNATLSSSGGANIISAPIALSNTLDATINSDTTLSGVISGSVGLNKLGTGALTIGGAGANTYSGLTTISAGNVILAKTSGNAIGGSITIGSGGTLTQSGSHQIADGASVTINTGGTWNFTFPAASTRSETIANLTLNGGSFGAGAAGSTGSTLTVTGTTTLTAGTFTSSTGGTRTVNFGELILSGGSVSASATSTSGQSNLTATNVTISNIASGAYTAMTFRERQTRATQFTVSGNVTFNGNSNTNAVTFADVLVESGTGVNTLVLTAGNHDFTINDGAAASDLVIEPRLAGAGANIDKKGAGTLELKDVNTYTGSTTISAGALLISGTGSINTTSGVTINGGSLRYTSSTAMSGVTVNVNGGAFLYNSSANFAGTLDFDAGTLGGTNLNGISLTGANAIGAGKIVSPGNSPGTLQVDDVAFADGGSYLWEINDLAGAQGNNPGWDWLSGAGNTLDLTALTAGGFTLQIDSLGALTGWNPAGTYSWTIASFTTISGFSAGDFVLNSSAFGDQNSLAGGAFSLTSDGSNLILGYAPVPEPSVVTLVGIGIAGCWLLRRRHGGRLV